MMYGNAPASVRQEHPIFGVEGVSVTTARFVVGQQTYPIAGITAVAPFFIPANKTSPNFFMVVGAFIAAGSVFSMFGGGPSGGAFFWLLVGAAAAAGGYFVGKGRKPTFGVRIMTAGQNVQALMSQDKMLVDRVLAALNEAIAMR